MSFLRISFSSIQQLKRRNYDPCMLRAAYDEVKKNKISVCKAAKMFGVPESTIRDRTLGIQPLPDSNGNYISNSGPAPLFTRSEEKQLIDHVNYMSSIGYGYSKKEFLHLATDFAISLKKKTESDPACAESWFKRFKKRNSELSLAKPQKLSLARAQATSDPVLDAYFAELRRVMNENGISDKPENIWNVDETGIVMEHSPSNVLCVKGSKPQAITSSRGKTATIIAGGSAAGNRLPPFYIFPGKRWNNELLEGATPGSSGTVTESGWSNSRVFLQFMESHFLKHVPIQDSPVMVLFEGHKSHVNLTLREWGKAHNIVFFLLPPHTSHVTQPLDVGCFGPLKRAYYSECQSFLRSIPGMQINRYNIAKLSSKAYNKALTPDNLISSFRKTGIYPLDRHYITPEKTAPSIIYHPPVDSQEHSSSSFLNSRKITQTVSTEKKRKHQSITGNLMSPSKENLKEISPEQPNKRINTQCSKKKLKLSQQPSPKVKPKTKNQSTNSPKPSTSGYHLINESSMDDTPDDISEEDLCCICKKLTPDALDIMYTIEFVNWGQCDKCNHWTHLKFCSEVRVLRRGDSFYCPHCKIET